MKNTIQGICPSKSNCYRFTLGGGMYKTKALTQYEKNFYIQCKERGRNITGYFEIEVDVFYPSQRADLDNSLKIILDCLENCNVIANDNKCVKIVARKFKDAIAPRIEYVINEISL